MDHNALSHQCGAHCTKKRLQCWLWVMLDLPLFLNQYLQGCMADQGCILLHAINWATAALHPQDMLLHPATSASVCSSQDASCLSAVAGKWRFWGLPCALRGTGLTREGGDHRNSHALHSTPHAIVLELCLMSIARPMLGMCRLWMTVHVVW